MDETRLTCVRCGGAFQLDSVAVRCGECDEPLEVRYPIRPMSPTNLPSGSVFERYAQYYPFLRIDPALSLGEGNTSLLRSHRVGGELGLGQLFFKNETQNPTWTFKDRGTACAIQHASSLGFDRVGTLSSGNMGASVAAFGRRAGMETFILLKADVPREKVDAIAVYQVNVVLVTGTYDSIYQRALDAGRAHRIYFTLSDEPFRVEGYKTVAFELFEQLGQHAPDSVAVPVGAGGLCRGILKGFDELRASGAIDRVPTIIGVQSEGCSPIADAYISGAERIGRFEHPQTLDHVLENPAPPSGNELLRRIRATGGVLIKVRNVEIVDAALRLAREGIFAQPASATALAGIVRCSREGKVPRDARVVSIVTGTGLKYPAVLESYGLSVTSTAIGDLTDTLGRLANSSSAVNGALGSRSMPDQRPAVQT